MRLLEGEENLVFLKQENHRNGDFEGFFIRRIKQHFVFFSQIQKL